MSAIATKEQIMAQARGEARSQATTIEQSRAIAEVQGALIVAERRPRDEVNAIGRALESCKTIELAERAFFSYPRGGETVSGPSIHLAVELARCWGNITYGIWELDRDDVRGQSEMAAYAWDLETNAQSRMGFIVPHKRDRKGGAVLLVDMRDIYENNANMGARRLRECIFRVLPPHLIEMAIRQCRVTLESKDSEKPIAVLVAETVEAFKKIGISRDRIEAKVGRSLDVFTHADIATLRVTYRSISRNEITAEDAFPKLGTEDTVRLINEAVTRQPSEDTPASEAGSRSEAAQGGSAATNAGSESDQPSVADAAGKGDDARDWDAWLDTLRSGLMAAGSVPDLNSFWSSKAVKADLASAPDEIRSAAKASFDSCMATLKSA